MAWPSKKLLILLVTVIATGLGLFIWQSHRAPTTGEAALKAVKSKISKHYVLPADEVPALATVTDTSKLSTPFFKGTKNGDQVLIYQKNHVAIIYRPSIDRIVSVGPVSIDAPPTALKQGNQ